MILSGTIQDKSGEPLMGANIYATASDGGKVGGVSDFDGNFNIDFTDQRLASPVTISYMGFKAKTFQPNQLQNAKVVLEEDVTSLDEVVVTAKKKENDAIVIDSTKPVSQKKLDEKKIIGIVSIGAGVLALAVLLIMIKKK